MTPTNETYELEGRTYARPEVPVTETDEFIANLRAVQDANNTDIKTQTENLGTDIASVQGGLIGPESYFTSRYQTPQTNQVVAELRSAAQASALNTALSNLQSQYQKRYQDAYRNYQKRASSGSGSGSGSGGGGTTSADGALQIDTNAGQQDQYVNEANAPQPGDLWYENGNTYYITRGTSGAVSTDAGEKWQLRNLTGSEPYSLGDWTATGRWPNGNVMSDGSTYQNDNGMYIYVKNAQTGDGNIYRVGDTPNFSYK